MIKKNQRMLNMFNRLSDFVLLIVAYLLSTYIRFDVMYGATPQLEIAWNPFYFQAALIYGVLIVFLYQYMHLYTPVRTKPFWRDAASILSANVLATAGLTGFLYITRIVDFSRIAIAMFLLFATVFIWVKHGCLRLLLREMRQRGYNQKHVILVGNGDLAHQYVSALADNQSYGYTIDGYLCRSERDGLGRCMGKYEDLETILKDTSIDEVVIALEPHETDFLHSIVMACDRQGTRAVIIPFFNNFTPDTLAVDLVGNCKLINIHTSPLDNIAMKIIKRTCDIVGSLFLIILFSPIMLIAVIGIKISSPGPIIFKQDRVGLGKKPFRMYKFRTMRVNPREDSGWSTKDDPRKTPFGSFLRKFSIDEMPQFFNILKGHMSLVGPRPEVPFYVDQFRDNVPNYMLKHQVRPGLTGWAQINGYRGDTSIEERIKCDIWYIENWSFWLDLSILARTALGGMVNREKLR